MVVDTAMSMSRGSPMEETDGMTLQSPQHWSAFLANHDQQLAAMRKQLEKFMRNATLSPATIETADKGGDQEQR